MIGRCMLFVVALAGLASAPGQAQEPSAEQRGEYVFRAAGGCSCHTDGKNDGAFMAGGRPIATPFGTVYATNITPDPRTGIGGWSDADFIAAMTEGVGPDGRSYFPVFPYPSFTRMTRQDLLDLKAYLFSVPAVEKVNKAPEMRLPFGWRPGLRVWKWLNFSPGVFQPDSTQSAAWNRGAYLVAALGHCGECHTPRDRTGGLQAALAYAGSADGPEGERAPNITPDEATGIGRWSTPDLGWYLQTGLKPDGDDTQGLMREVIEQGYRYLREADLEAIAIYLRSLEPVRNQVGDEER